MNCVPAATSIAFEIPATSTGAVRGVMVLSPNCPASLRPQQKTFPEETAHVCCSPAEIDTTDATPSKRVGVSRCRFELSPTWPKKLLPQHHANPSVSRAQE